MTASKDETESIVLDFALLRPFLRTCFKMQCDIFLRRIEASASPYSVNSLESRSRYQLGTGFVGLPRLGPGIQSGSKCFVH